MIFGKLEKALQLFLFEVEAARFFELQVYSGQGTDRFLEQSDFYKLDCILMYIVYNGWKNGHVGETCMRRKKNVKKGSVKSRRNISVKKKPSAGDWTGGIVQIYLFVMFGILPLYYYDGLFYVSRYKYFLFRTATLIMLVLLGMELISNRLTEIGGTKRRKQVQFAVVKEWIGCQLSKLSLTDIAVLCYALLAVVSWILTEYRAESWTGAFMWNMGLLSQLLFVGIYFAVSRFFPYKKSILWVMVAGGAIAFLIAYLHRFSIDPLGLQKELPNKITFLGTMGNADYYSTYVSVVLPAMMGAYIAFWRENTRIEKVSRGIMRMVIFLGFCSAVTQNSDSVYVGLGVAFLFLLWFALGDGITWKKYVEVGLLAVLAAKITGLLQGMFPERVPSLEPFSLMITQRKEGWLVLALAFMIYGVTCAVQNKSNKKVLAVFAENVRRIRVVFLVLLAVGGIGLPVLMCLVTMGKISLREGIWQQTGYLVFDSSWGSGRGTIWRICFQVFMEYPLFRKLFGCGPDVLGTYLEDHYNEVIRTLWGNLRINNAHNEWINAVMEYGIIGGITYLTIFISVMVRIIKSKKRHPILIVAGTAILAYMGHNVFCFQHTVCTPLIFIIIGVAERTMRMEMYKNRNI